VSDIWLGMDELCVDACGQVVEDFKDPPAELVVETGLDGFTDLPLGAVKKSLHSFEALTIK
jgi:hypothetical protein